jgi:hypothetical protein
MKELVFVLSEKDEEALGTVRCLPHVRVAEVEEKLWVRGIQPQSIDLKLRQLPTQATYALDEADNLFPLGGLTPIGKLTAHEWIPIASFIPVELPTSAMPAKIGARYPISLFASDQVREGAALVTTLPVWKAYAESVPEVRLKRLAFAVSATNQVFVLGTPLPAIPGKEYWMQDTMLLPSGFDFELPLVSSLLANQLNPDNDSIILFQENSEWEKIERDCLIPATRTAIRLTEGKRKP